MTTTTRNMTIPATARPKPTRGVTNRNVLPRRDLLLEKTGQARLARKSPSESRVQASWSGKLLRRWPQPQKKRSAVIRIPSGQIHAESIATWIGIAPDGAGSAPLAWARVMVYAARPPCPPRRYSELKWLSPGRLDAGGNWSTQPNVAR